MKKQAFFKNPTRRTFLGRSLGGALSVLAIAHGCGRNILEKKAPKSDLELAEIDMEEGRYEAAQERLQTLLSKESENQPARSLLAASVAAQAGIVMLDLIEKGATASQQGGGSSSSKAIIALMPNASSDNVTRMKVASAHMTDIPEASRSGPMKVQTGLFLTVYSLLRIKYLTENPAELLAMSPTEAAAFITDLLANMSQASAAFGGDTSPFNTAIGATAAALQAASGSDGKEKLSAFVATVSP